MNETPMSGPLADLERRWAGDRSPQLTLHLAEEHRRGGNTSRALEVLREGLEHHPGHVAARVALGRYLLEDGDARGAAETLESVLAEDPTHLVANKLIVGAALDLGDIRTARNRLDLYETLNAGDTDIEVLRERMRGAETEPEGSQAQPLAPSTQVEDDAAPTEEASATTAGERVLDPFADIWTLPAAVDYESSLRAEGIFDLPESRDAATSMESVAESPEEATVTLGRLYLEQGHKNEAERIFRSVLESEPDNEEARQGLSDLLQEEPDLTAMHLVSAAALARAESPGDRRRLVLEAYRDRLRANRAGVG